MSDARSQPVTLPGGLPLARQVEELWRQGQPPDVPQLLAAAEPVPPGELAAALAIDQWHRWHAGERIPAEEYLRRYPALEAFPESALELIYGEFMVREELGEGPAAEEYLRRFPQHADRLGQQFQLHRGLEGGASRSRATAVGGAEATLGQPAARAGTAGAPGGTSWPAVEGYEILGELGRGGMGVVYEARQLGLNRLVALKFMRWAADSSSHERTRFRGEAEAVARLQHPNIVQIHEIGEQEGRPFFALEFCKGGSLARKVNGTPQPARAAAELVETLARAVHAAHQLNIVHRDLKPDNVLLTADGTPKVTDFGLAKRLDIAGQTQSGAVMGTPSYMAPEQAEGKGKEVGPAADTYALGAILYELLTGRPPFKAATALDTILQVVSEEPVPPSQLNPKVPRDLETVCLKCLQKEPKKRYASAEALAADLRRFLDGRPVLARPVAPVERLWRWCRRRPALASLSLALVLAVAVGVGGVVWEWREAEANYAEAEGQRLLARRHADTAEAQAREAQEQRARAEEQELAQRRLVYAFRMKQVSDDWQRGDVAAVQRHLATFLPAPGQKDVRGFEWHYFWNLLHNSRLLLFGHSRPVRSVAFSPDGKTLASSGDDGLVKLWDVARGEERATVRPSRVLSVVRVAPPSDTKSLTVIVVRGGIDWLERLEVPGEKVLGWFSLPEHGGFPEFSPDGKSVAGGAGKAVKLMDVGTGKELASFAGHAQRVACVSLSPDGRRVASAAVDGTIKLWEHGRQAEVAGARGHAGEVRCLALSRDGRMLASGGADQVVKLWDIDWTAGRLTQRAACLGDSAAVECVAFAPDGKTLASGGAGDQTAGEVKVWDAASGRERASLAGHARGVNAIAFSPDGRALATGSVDATVRVWDVTALPPSGRATLHRSRSPTVRGVACSPDGKIVASGGADGTVRLWDADEGGELAVLRGHTQAVMSVAFSPDGRVLASGGWDRTVRLWDVASRRLRQALWDSDPVYRVAFSPDGKTLATGNTRGTIRLWEMATGRQRAAFAKHLRVIWGLAFAPRGHTLATADGGRSLVLWDAGTGRDRVTLRTSDWITAVAFSPREHIVATGEQNGAVRLWDEGGERDQPSRGGSTVAVRGLAFSPDGKTLAWSSLYGDEGQLNAWNLDTRRFRWDEGARFSPGPALAFCGADQLVTGGYDGTLALWDVATLRRRGHLWGHGRGVQALAVSPSGQTLFVACTDGRLRLVAADTEEVRATLEGHTDVVSALALSADGKLLASAGRDTTVRLWNPATGRALRTLTGHRRAVAVAAFSPDGLTLATGGGSVRDAGELILWDVAAGKERARLRGHEWTVRAVAFSPDGRLLVSASAYGFTNVPGEVKVWDPVAGRQVTDLPGQPTPVFAVAFAPDGRALATGDGEGTVRVWAVPPPGGSWRIPINLVGPRQAIKALTFSPDGRALASGGGDRTVRLWDLALGRELVTLRGFRDRVNALAFAPDGRFLAVGCEDGVLDLRRAPVLRTGAGREPLPSEADRSADLAADTEYELARARVTFYETLWKMGRRQEATAVWQRLTPLLDKLSRVTPARAGQARQLADSLLRLTQPSDPDRLAAAEEALRRAVGLRERLAVASPDVKSQEELLWVFGHQGDFYRHRKQTAAAVRAFGRAVQVGETLVGESGTAFHRNLLAHGALNLGKLLERDQPKEAERLLTRAVALREQLVAESPASTDLRERLAVALVWQGALLQQGGRSAEAEAAYRRSIALRRRLRADLPGDDLIRRNHAGTLRLLARLIQPRNPAEAAQLFREAAALGK